MFEKSLPDLIRGIRANKRNESAYIAKCLEEIHVELNSSDDGTKTNAISKLCYLQMLGYDMNWAAFNVVEVMAHTKFSEKRAGYLAAMQSFHQETDVMMLVPNLIKKDLASMDIMELNVALDGLAQIVTPELAINLFHDLLGLLNHNRPFIRKKVILTLYKTVLKYPEGLVEAFPRLKERLGDPDFSVVGAAVSVICELARTNPKNYLALAPRLYQLLNTSSNNWMLIKIVKLFSSLASIEPRLAKKLHGPVSSLILRTSAMSLLYECIHTSIVGGIVDIPTLITMEDGSQITLAELCASKLEPFLQSFDQNLRYLGLLALLKLQQKDPKLARENYETVLKCLDDPDMNIRLRALQVISPMATRRTLVRIVKKLISQLILSQTAELQAYTDPISPEVSDGEADVTREHAHGLFVTNDNRLGGTNAVDPADDPDYRRAVVETILDVCTRQSYSLITDFSWYVAVLVDLARVSLVNISELLCQKWVDVTVRVVSVRERSVQMAVQLLKDLEFASTYGEETSCAGVLRAAAYIAGEYCRYQVQPDIGLLDVLVNPNIARYNAETQQVYVQAAMKVYALWLNAQAQEWSDEVWDSLRGVSNRLLRSVSDYISAQGLVCPAECQSRAKNLLELLKLVSTVTSNPTPAPPPILTELHAMFTSYDLNPIAPAAQAKVPVPESLDLDSWIDTPVPDTALTLFPPTPLSTSPTLADKRLASVGGRRSKGSSGIGGAVDSRAAHISKGGGRFYLGSGNGGGSSKSGASHVSHPANGRDINEIPIIELKLDDSTTSQSAADGRGRRKGRQQRRRRYSSSPSPESPLKVEIAQDEDMPGETTMDGAPLENKDAADLGGSHDDSRGGDPRAASVTSQRTQGVAGGGDNGSETKQQFPREKKGDVLENTDLSRLGQLDLRSSRSTPGPLESAGRPQTLSLSAAHRGAVHSDASVGNSECNGHSATASRPKGNRKKKKGKRAPSAAK